MTVSVLMKEVISVQFQHCALCGYIYPANGTGECPYCGYKPDQKSSMQQINYAEINRAVRERLKKKACA